MPDLSTSQSVPGLTDFVYSNVQGILYIVTTDGDLVRYNVFDQTFRPEIELGGPLSAVAISPNGSNLLIGRDEIIYEGGTHTILDRVHVYSLNITQIEMPLESGEVGIADIAWLDTNFGLISTEYGGSGGTPLHGMRPSSSTWQEVDFLDRDGDYRAPPYLIPSEDNEYVLVLHGNVSNGPMTMIHVSTGTTIYSDFRHFGVTTAFHRGAADVSSAEELVVVAANGRVLVLSMNLQSLVFDLSSALPSSYNYAVQFTQEGRQVLVYNYSERGYVVFDTLTFEQVGFLESEILAGFAAELSADGRFLFVETYPDRDVSSGFEVIDLAERLNLVIDGDAGIDELRGSVGRDTLSGAAGDDLLSGFGNGDVLDGGRDNDQLWGGEGQDLLTGGAGNDLIDGGGDVDRAVFSGNFADYDITIGADAITITGPDGMDMVTNVEFFIFDDREWHAPRGLGREIDFGADPSTYMEDIRDFDGNDLGASSFWTLIGSTDVQGDGDLEYIYFNRENGRWATVGPQENGLVYFEDHSWGGDTRVVGIYIDPLVAQGIVEQGSEYDSQRRFQNDINIGNIAGILGSGDYNRDGLQEVYFSLTDGTAYLHAYMHADGNIQYANYQNQAQVEYYMDLYGVDPAVYEDWFPDASGLVSGQDDFAAV